MVQLDNKLLGFSERREPLTYPTPSFPRRRESIYQKEQSTTQHARVSGQQSPAFFLKSPNKKRLITLSP
tara:strand:- start:1553 stop:1759 length:207 start_codon:yes stop_codon:yes gene_type:complete